MPFVRSIELTLVCFLGFAAVAIVCYASWRNRTRPFHCLSSSPPMLEKQAKLTCVQLAWCVFVGFMYSVVNKYGYFIHQWDMALKDASNYFRVRIDSLTNPSGTWWLGRGLFADLAILSLSSFSTVGLSFYATTSPLPSSRSPLSSNGFTFSYRARLETPFGGSPRSWPGLTSWPV